MTDGSQYDVVIVGAGPAGLSAARTTARLGFRTLVLERLSQAGELRHPCSGIVTPVPGFVATRRLLDGLFIPSVDLLIPASLILGYPPAQRLVSPGGQKYEAPFSDRDSFAAAVVDKPGLLKLMATQAESAGAELQFGVAVKGLLKEDGQIAGVLVGEREIRSSIVISAEGAARTLCIEAGVGAHTPPKQHVILVNQDMKAPNASADNVGQMLTMGSRYTTAPQAFGMVVVPAPGRASIFLTLYSDPDHPISDSFLWYYMDEYVRNDARVRDVLAGARVIGRTHLRVGLQDPPEHVVADGFLGVGDAITPAGRLGILPSIYLGRQAAFMAAEAIDLGDFSAETLAPYDQLLHESILPNLETEIRLMLGLTRMRDDEIDRLCQALNGLNRSTPFFSNWRTLAWDMVSWMARQFPLMVHDWQLLQRVSQGTGADPQ